MVIGVLIGILLMVSYGGMFYLGYKFAEKTKPPVEYEEVEEKEKMKAKLRDEGFQNIMNYDINIALGREDIDEWNS